MRLVDESVLRFDLLAVEADRRAPERLQLQAGGGDDDVGVEVLSRIQRDAGGVDVVDVVGHQFDAAGADRREQVAVGDQAHALVPRVVARLEVHVDGIADGKIGHGPTADEPAHQLRELARHEPDEALLQGVAPLAVRMRHAARRRLYEPTPWTGRDCGRPWRRRWGTCSMVTFSACRATAGHQRDRGGAAADHHHLLAGSSPGPRARTADAPRRRRWASREVGCVALVVRVVAAAEEHEPGPVGLRRAVLLYLHRPGVGGRVPVRGAHQAAEPDVGVDAVLAGGGRHVLADVVTVGHALLAGPRLPREAQREDAAVAAHARVPEQIPGAADWSRRSRIT